MAYIIAIGAYLLALMIFGLVVAHKKVKTSDDMVTGGHRIPFIVLVGTLLATWCGGGGITGSASVVYTGGPWVGLLTFAAPPIGIILLYFIAGKVRKSNKVTVPEIMEARYGTASTVFCTQFRQKDWHARLGGGVHADAIMDRIVHGAAWVGMGETNMRRKLGGDSG